MRETTRRQFTRGIGATLASGTALTFLPDGGLGKLESEDDEIEYVAYKKIVDRKKGQPPERVPIYDTINKNEWVRRKTALDVRDKMATELQRKGVGSVSSIFRSMDDSPTGFGVELSIERKVDRDGEIISDSPSKKEVENKFPSEATGKVAEKGVEDTRRVPITITESETRPVYGPNNDYDWYAYPGGCSYNCRQTTR